MFCTKCGKEVPDGMKFCSGCGAPLGKATENEEVKAEAQPAEAQAAQSAPAAATPATPAPAAPVAAAPVAAPAPAPAPAYVQNMSTGVAGQPAPTVKVMPQKPIKKKATGKVVAIIVIAVVLIAATVAGFLVIRNIRAKRAEEVRKMLKKADKYVDEMDFDEAISLYQEVLEMDKKNLNAYLGLANAYIGTRDYYSALDILHTALENVNKEDVDDVEDLLEEVEDVVDIKSVFSGNVVIGDEDIVYGNNFPLEGVKVSIESIDFPEEYEFSKTEYTDEYGNYSFSGMHLGTYEITYECNGYATATQTIEVYPEQTEYNNQIIELIPDDLSGNGTASGYITDARNGYGVGGLDLEIREGYNNTTGRVVGNTTTDYNGYYQTESLPAGIYSITVIDNRDLEDGETNFVDGLINIKILGDRNIDNQNGAVSDILMAGQIRVVMRWGESPSDLDSHFFCNLDSGETYHVYYGDKSFYVDDSLIAFLDHDDTTSYGPETVTLYDPRDGVFTYGIYNYSHSSDQQLRNSACTVEVYMGNSSIPDYIYYVPQVDGYFWEVFSYDSETRRVTSINEVYYDYDSSNYY